ncbi:hypothetical protein P7H46_13395 [Enterococcus pseudoavium]|uniref:Holin n=1 Tax=Enterococcus pseudoavium TaxID=44007 RepID=A0ABU3FM44_9ENTE|nr:hypothetical protein [Enterococcus pseudoavium]MDT2771810.1 hypothetical protein [Enterococcus pseudoavium]
MENYKNWLPTLCVVSAITAINVFLGLNPFSMVIATACVCLIAHVVFKGLSGLKK